MRIQHEYFMKYVEGQREGTFTTVTCFETTSSYNSY